MKQDTIKTLVVDRTDELTDRIRSLLEASEAEVCRESSMDRVLERFEQEAFDMLVVSSSAFKAGRADGLAMLELIAYNSPTTQVLFLCEGPDVKTAMAALKAGSYQYARLPIQDEELKLLIETSIEKRPAYGANLLLKSERQEVKFQKLVGRSPAMQAVYQQIRQAAATDIAVLLCGETGTGKDLAAQAIHQQSSRVGGPFVAVNLGALPSELIASELFGHKKGAFTGAVEQRAGKFEQADSGTIFLDEIDAVDDKVQIALLRLIEEKRFHRIGGRQTLSNNARIITASNQDLGDLVAKGMFREDLYYRLDVFRIVMPPLRDRYGDISLLIDEFVKHSNLTFRKDILGIAPECLSLLEGYDWPGNVRELKNVIQRAVLVGTGGVLLAEHLPPRFRAVQSERPKVTFELGTPLADVEREMVARALAASKNNRKRAAEMLGISRRALYNKLARYGLK